MPVYKTNGKNQPMAVNTMVKTSVNSDGERLGVETSDPRCLTSLKHFGRARTRFIYAIAINKRTDSHILKTLILH